MSTPSCIDNFYQFWLFCLGPIVYLLPDLFILISNLLTMSVYVLNKGYSKKHLLRYPRFFNLFLLLYGYNQT